MWLLENVGNSLQGRRLWLRPGKRYLFGRTKGETGQLVISDKTISRKHLTIEVDRVKEGDGRNRNSKSAITVEDLNTKIGTVVNGKQIRGQKVVLTHESNDIKMGHLADIFKILWKPVVLSFSFTTKELLSDPWAKLDGDLEQLDIKYIAEYDIALTTHIVARKRNTSKGLQALINGKYIVAESFISAVVEVAATNASSGNSNAIEPCPLEQDFDGCWPNALEHLPPRGDEPSDRPISTYGPDQRRKGLFDGYTFVFYDQKQYENLLSPITNGKGKALLGEVVPGQTEVDDFVEYAKGIAGEKGLGEFEDNSEGRGVVVVRYLPAKGDYVDWFVQFSRSVSIRLGHRLVDQRDFLDAILAVEPGTLRKPLQEEQDEAGVRPLPEVTEVDSVAPMATQNSATQSSSKPRLGRGRARRGAASRFKGFDIDLDLENEPDSFNAQATSIESSQAPDEGMFVSQSTQTKNIEDDAASKRGLRKRRTAASVNEDDMMDDIAPTAAAVKRRRIEAGIDPIPPVEAEDEEADAEEINPCTPATAAGKGKDKSTKENGILDQARRNREAAEKRAAKEREQLEHIPDDGIDAEEIRKLTIVEEVSVREPAATRSREQDIADGRWDPAWNGRCNFKQFRKQGDPVGRPLRRVIVGLEPAKTKEYGIGDDYWLEGEENNTWKGKKKGSQQQSTGAGSSIPVKSTIGSSSSDQWNSGRVASTSNGQRPVEVVMSDPFSGTGRNGAGSNISISLGLADLELVPDTEPEVDSGGEPEPGPIIGDLPRTRAGKIAERTAARQSQATQEKVQTRRARDQQDQTQSSTAETPQPLGRGKRVVSGSTASRAPPAKRPRRGVAPITIDDSDSDDDGLKFKPRRRR